jgi:sulfopyruvate decarboxylase TPP-binding subunit
MPPIVEQFVSACRDASIDYVIGVPDSYLAPLIESVSEAPDIQYIAAAREEECFGIASGLAICKKRPLVLVQNVGFMNSIGCFSTLCLTYRTPFLVIVANRGNVYDKTKYDVQKFRYFNKIVEAMNVFSVSWRTFRDEKDLIKMCYERSVVASEPVLLLLDMPPG